ncbi:MAG: glycosyltransferase family 2 protein [Saprospiraceae bacterium]|nr:glycosyltransferase family 2 protein [Saprospiraceae bacterium]
MRPPIFYLGVITGKIKEKMSISVIIPVYNSSNTLEKAVESCLIQNEVSEIVLINDVSNDNTLELCIKLSNLYKRIKVVNVDSNINLGAGNARNLGILISKNDYIAF